MSGKKGCSGGARPGAGRPRGAKISSTASKTDRSRLKCVECDAVFSQPCQHGRVAKCCYSCREDRGYRISKKHANEALAEDGLKMCWLCSKVKLHAEFFRSAATWDGLAGRCKECARHAADAWANTNPDRVRELHREWNKRTGHCRSESERAKRRAREATNREHRLEQKRLRGKTMRGRQIRLAAYRRYAERHPEKIRDQWRRQVKRDVAELTDRYVADLLGAPVRKLPRDLIELKREHLRLVRLLKEKQK